MPSTCTSKSSCPAATRPRPKLPKSTSKPPTRASSRSHDLASTYDLSSRGGAEGPTSALAFLSVIPSGNLLLHLLLSLPVLRRHPDPRVQRRVRAALALTLAHSALRNVATFAPLCVKAPALACRTRTARRLANRKYPRVIATLDHDLLIERLIHIAYHVQRFANL